MLRNGLLLLNLVIFVIVVAVANCYSPRIIGGSNTTVDMFPYQVSIHDKGEFKCGGSIVSKNWVLTAAHCVSRSRAADLKIRVHSTYSDRDGTLINNVKQIKIHQDYSPSTLEYDAALLELGSPIPYPAPVVLADTTTVVATGSKAVVTGWGATSNPGPKSDVLQTLAMPIVDQAKCNDIFRDVRSVTNVMLCAGSMSGGKDVCRGDSGGPLVLNGAQIGIVSWGMECAKAGYPSVYTRVSAIRRWIKTLTMV